HHARSVFSPLSPALCHKHTPPPLFPLRPAGISGSDRNSRCASVPRKRAISRSPLPMARRGSSSVVSDGRRIFAAGGEGSALAVSHGGSAAFSFVAREPSSVSVGTPLRKRQILPSVSLPSSDRGWSALRTRSCQQPSGAFLIPFAPHTKSRSAARVSPTYKRRRYSSHAASIACARASTIGPASFSLATPQIKAVAPGGAPVIGAISRRGG